MKKFDIIVIGGGLVGSTFALDLAVKNPKFNIAILEKTIQKEFDPTLVDSRIYAISPDNVNYLKILHAWPTNEERIGIITTMDVSGEGGGNILLEAKLAYRDYLAKTIEGNYLQHYLYEELKKLLNVTFINNSLDDLIITDDLVKVICNNETYIARLIVGADGAKSLVRKKSNLEGNCSSYEQSGVVANFTCEKEHKNIAYQWFLKDSILAYLPLSNNQISIVWATPNSKHLLSLNESEFCDQVAKASRYKLGRLNLITKPLSFPLSLYTLDKFYTERVALIGDAAHLIHPLAGQGVNLGFGDSRELADILAKVNDYQLGDSSLLAKYNARRLPHVKQMQIICHSLYHLFNNQLPLLTKIANSGLNIVNSLPLLKKYLIKHAIKY